MRRYSWDPEKNRLLKADSSRSICFEDIVTAIEGDGLLDDIAHENAAKYAHQRMFVVLHKGYVYGVPYVIDGSDVFLKTAFPSRKLTKFYLDQDNG